MKTNVKNLSLVLFSATSLLTVACGGSKVVVVPAATAPSSNAIVAPAPAQVVVTSIPVAPQPLQETASVSPGSDYVWVAGYYNWLGDHYTWVLGNWVRVPRVSAAWVPAHWQPTAGGYTWVEGHWQ
jgi:hypothetical protein